MWAYASAIMLGMTEVAAEKGDSYAIKKLEEMKKHKENSDDKEAVDVDENEVEEITVDGEDDDNEGVKTGSSTVEQKNTESHIEL